MADEELKETVEIHNQLNPKIWTDEKELIPEVRAKILQIVDKFKSQLAVDGLELKVEDIYVLGSNANYNYTEESDLDVHIIADESFDCSEEHLAMLYNCYKALFNSKYNIRIKGINVEIYVENKDKLSNVSAGIYSLNDGWIKDPAEYEIPEFDQFAVDRGVQQWEDKYFAITENPSIKKIDEYIDGIYELRQSTIKNGEFAEGNLIFKEIRRRGYLDDLRELKIDLTSKELSLESLDLVKEAMVNGADTRWLALRSLKRELERTGGYGLLFDPIEKDENGDYTFAVRDWGNWEVPYDAEDEEDYDWKVLSQESKERLKKLIKIVYQASRSVIISFEEGEKCWLYFTCSERVNEAQQKLRYHYCGPVYHFQYLLDDSWEAYTEAVSEAQALNNLTVKAKNYFGFVLSSRITLNPDYLETYEPKDDFIPTEEKRRCPHCGLNLNDAGECPLCDLGDYSVLDESDEESIRHDAEMDKMINQLFDEYDLEDDFINDVEYVLGPDSLIMLCNKTLSKADKKNIDIYVTAPEKRRYVAMNRERTFVSEYGLSHDQTKNKVYIGFTQPSLSKFTQEQIDAMSEEEFIKETNDLVKAVADEFGLEYCKVVEDNNIFGEYNNQLIIETLIVNLIPDEDGDFEPIKL